MARTVGSYTACVVFNDKPSRFEKNFLVIENEVVYYLMRTLKQNEFKYIMTLLMTQNKFALPLRTISDKTGIPQCKISAIRDGLVQKGLIDYSPYGYIVVRYGYIQQLAMADVDNRKIRKKELTNNEVEEIESQLKELGDLLDEEEIQEAIKSRVIPEFEF